MAMKTMTGLATIFALMAGAASAELKIGFLSDMSGATSVLTGESARVAAQMAVDDFGGIVNGEPIKMIVADHLNKPDVGLGIAREWLDVEKVNVVLSADNSAVALAVSDLIKDKPVMMVHGASTAKLTNENCLPNQIQSLMDTYGLARAITIPLVEQGEKKWFFITVDYAFGHDLEAKGIAGVQQAGGEVVGSVRHAPSTTDFSAFLLEAQSKGATTIALATFGNWQNTIIKQAEEFGLDVTLVPYFMGDTDIKATGLDNLKGVKGAIQFYWDENDQTREFSTRFEAKFGRPPTFTNAMNYEMTRHYLKAVAAVGSADADKVQGWMKANPVEMINGDVSTIRADGRVARPMYTFEVKEASESKGDWDFLKLTGRVAPETLLLPAAESTCALLK